MFTISIFQIFLMLEIFMVKSGLGNVNIKKNTTKTNSIDNASTRG